MKTLLLILALSSSGTDAYLTHRDFGRSFREYDPLARPFVRNTPDLVLSTAGLMGAKTFLVYRLRKHHHDKLANAIDLAQISGNTTGAVISAVHHR